MGELLSTTDKANFQTSYLDIFDTFKKAIVIHKEPIKKVDKANSESTLPGYNESSNPTNYTFIPVSKTFHALIRYSANQEVGVADIGIQIPEGQVRIKVRQDARDYLMSGKNEKLTFDGKSFNLISRDTIRDYFGLKIYAFLLEEIV
jgi:hypothetical protein